MRVDPAPLTREAIIAGLAALLGVLLLLFCIAWWLLPADGFLGLDSSVKDTVARIRSWGVWGIAASVALMVAHSFLPFPAEVVALANGMVFGPLWGAVITWVGAMLGATMAYGLARWLGQPFVRRILSPGRVRQLEQWSHERGGLALLVGRLIPLLAFNLLNYGAALAGIQWRTFLWATGVGILPLTIVLSFAGDRVLDLPPWTWIVFSIVLTAIWLAAKAFGFATAADESESK